MFYLEVPDALETVYADEEGDTETDTETDEPKNYITIPAGVGAIGIHANQKGAFYISGFSIKNEETLSINEVEEPAEGIFVSGDKIFFGSVADAKVYDLSGRCIMTAAGASSLSLAGLGRGVYIVSADISGTVSTIKVTK